MWVNKKMSNHPENSVDNPPFFETPKLEFQKHFQVTCINNRKLFNCLHPDCGKTFKFYSEIRRHLLIHDQGRPFVCSFPNCYKSFKRADALNNHLRIHYKITPFECPVEGCEYKSTTKSALRYHLLRHNGEKIFTCSHEGCQKTFLTCSQLQQHETTLYHQNKTSMISEKDDGDLVDGQIYYFEKITLDPNQNNPIDQTLSLKRNASDQLFTDEVFNDFLKINSEGSNLHAPPNVDIKPESFSIEGFQQNDSLDLEFQLSQAVQENLNLKQSLKTATDLLTIYKRKEELGVDMFLTPGPELDQEKKKEELLWTSLHDQLKGSNYKI